MSTILERLKEMNANKRLHHGFLFIGGGEKTSVVIENTINDFAVHLFSMDDQSPDLARKKITSLSHPDFFRLKPADGEIKIEEIRDLQKWLSLPPLETTKKIAIIENAQHLNASCSNALLKTLEEPPTYALIILQTNSASRILPTIRSRLFGIQFPQFEGGGEQEEKEWIPELESMLSKKNYSDKDIFSFTEQLSDKRDDLVYFFNIVQKSIRERMLHTNSIQFNRLEKVFDLTLNLEQELYQNYGNISLGLDRFFMEWRNT